MFYWQSWFLCFRCLKMVEERRLEVHMYLAHVPFGCLICFHKYDKKVLFSLFILSVPSLFYRRKRGTLACIFLSCCNLLYFSLYSIPPHLSVSLSLFFFFFYASLFLCLSVFSITQWHWMSVLLSIYFTVYMYPVILYICISVSRSLRLSVSLFHYISVSHFIFNILPFSLLYLSLFQPDIEDHIINHQSTHLMLGLQPFWSNPVTFSFILYVQPLSFSSGYRAIT